MEEFLHFFREPGSFEYNFWGLLTLLAGVLAYLTLDQAFRKPARYKESTRRFLYTHPNVRTIAFALPPILFALCSVLLMEHAIDYFQAQEYRGVTYLVVAIAEIITLPVAACAAVRQWKKPKRRLRTATISSVPRRPRKFDRYVPYQRLAQGALETDPVHQARIANHRREDMLFEAERRVKMLEEEARLRQRCVT